MNDQIKITRTLLLQTLVPILAIWVGIGCQGPSGSKPEEFHFQQFEVLQGQFKKTGCTQDSDDILCASVESEAQKYDQIVSLRKALSSLQNPASDKKHPFSLQALKIQNTQNLEASLKVKLAELRSLYALKYYSDESFNSTDPLVQANVLLNKILSAINTFNLNSDFTLFQNNLNDQWILKYTRAFWLQTEPDEREILFPLAHVQEILSRIDDAEKLEISDLYKSMNLDQLRKVLIEKREGLKNETH